MGNKAHQPGNKSVLLSKNTESPTKATPVIALASDAKNRELTWLSDFLQIIQPITLSNCDDIL